MATIFLSYRRDDSADVTGRIYDGLESHFGKQDLFMDVDSIPLGADFVQILEERVRDSLVMLVVIGPIWVGHQERTRSRRIDDPNDFVRLEIELAHSHGITVIPLLVTGAQMPASAELPPSLRWLATRNAVPIRPNPDFHKDMDRLIAAIEATRLMVEDARKRREEANKQRHAVESTRTSRDESSLEAGLSSVVSTVGRYIFAAFWRITLWVVVIFLIAGIVSAGATEVVGSLLTDTAPPSGPTHLSAAVIGILAGGLIALIFAGVQVIRDIVRGIGLLVEETERLAEEAMAEVEAMAQAGVPLPDVSGTGGVGRGLLPDLHGPDT
jgi:hypothetical protein